MPSKSQIQKLTQMAQYGTGPEADTARRRLRKLGYDVSSKTEPSQALVPYKPQESAVSTIVDGAAKVAEASPIPWMKVIGAGVDLVKQNWDWIGPNVKKGASWLWNKVVGKFTKPKNPIVTPPGGTKPLPGLIKESIDWKLNGGKDVPKSVVVRPSSNVVISPSQSSSGIALPATVSTDIVSLPSAVVAPGQGVIVSQSLSPAETTITEQASEYPNSFANLLVHNPNRSYEGTLPLRSSLFTSARRRMGSNAGVFDSFISPGRYHTRRSVRIY